MGSIDRNSKWSELNKKLQEVMPSKNWQEMKSIYWEMIGICFEEGRSTLHLCNAAALCDLYAYQESEIKQVEISSARDERVCEECRNLDGKIFDIEYAICNNPLARHCKAKYKDSNHCRCSFLPIVN